jgi:monovalent cation/hydrogen antiporter
VTLLEGESLINDATALVIYRAALAATAVAFSASATSARFLVVGIGGVLVGLVIAWMIAWLLRQLSDSPVQITLSLLTPFAAYIPAEALGLSGVLSAVVAGLYLGWREPYFSRSEARLRGRAVWEMVDFILNGLVFILIGLQLSTILCTLAGRSLIELVGSCLLLSLAAILVRLAWVFLDAYLRWWLVRPPRSADGAPHWRETFVVGWAGMRGVVSLAAALALPQATPERDVLIFLTFVVILVTLVGQGISLPWFIRKLGLGAASGVVAHQELHARTIAVEAALAQIEQLRGEWPTHLPLIDSLQMQYGHRVAHLGHAPDALRMARNQSIRSCWNITSFAAR